MPEPLTVAIVGCGLIGAKRAKALGGCRVRVCCDAVAERAESLAARYPGAEAVADWHAATTHPEVDIVIVATTHDQLAPIAAAAAAAGKHVLIEKPGARRAAELDPVLAAAQRTGVAVRVGFNHRYHRAVQEARRIFLSGALGEMMFIRGRYGHGGRIGYDREWRADPQVSGGGELLDQGIHLIDLSRWFLGDFDTVQGRIATYFWDMPVEDNAFLILTTPGGQTAFLHATWTEWKNLFSLEVACRTAKLQVDGLAGSYGAQRLTVYRMRPELGPPDVEQVEFPAEDVSWRLEWEDFRAATAAGGPQLESARYAWGIVEAAYEATS